VPPLVSVIIPTFNRAVFVHEAITSVLAQDYAPLEVIVVDDGSQDDTPAALRHFGAQILYMPQEHAGVSAARNRGVAASHGALVAFLDSDDLWLPQKVSAQVALFAGQPQVQACYTDEIWIRRGVRVNPRLIHAKHAGWIFLQSLPRCIISPSSIMLRRPLWERLGGFDESLPACEDYDLWLRLTAVVPVALLPERLIIKRGGHADQLSHTTPVLDQYRIAALEKILTASLTMPQQRAVLEHLVQKCDIVAQGAHKRALPERGAVYEAKKYGYMRRLAQLKQCT
jgi:glycosyltransferase involved in cell wall biosynthesis